MTAELMPPAAPMSEELVDEQLRQQNERELSYRRGYGITVILSWLRDKNVLKLAYEDESAGENWGTIIPNDKGNEAFAHPNSFRPGGK